jgi:hypothetical protein
MWTTLILGLCLFATSANLSFASHPSVCGLQKLNCSVRQVHGHASKLHHVSNQILDHLSDEHFNRRIHQETEHERKKLQEVKDWLRHVARGKLEKDNRELLLRRIDAALAWLEADLSGLEAPVAAEIIAARRWYHHFQVTDNITELSELSRKVKDPESQTKLLSLVDDLKKLDGLLKPRKFAEINNEMQEVTINHLVNLYPQLFKSLEKVTESLGKPRSWGQRFKDLFTSNRRLERSLESALRETIGSLSVLVPPDFYLKNNKLHAKFNTYKTEHLEKGKAPQSLLDRWKRAKKEKLDELKLRSVSQVPKDRHVLFVAGFMNEMASLTSNYFPDNIKAVTRELGLSSSYYGPSSRNTISENADHLFKEFNKTHSKYRKPTDLFGHSMGGAASLLLVLRHPELMIEGKIDRVALIQLCHAS